jgi:hypothetical protein
MSGKTAAAAYDCETCESKDCKRVWKFKHCPVCFGKRKACELCNGTGVVTDERCPASLSSGIQFIYFNEWIHARRFGITQWPDGKPTLYQPIKLREAYLLLDQCYEYVRSKDG